MDGSFPHNGGKVFRKRRRRLPSQVPLAAQELSITDPYFATTHIADAPIDQMQLLQQYLDAPYDLGQPATEAFVISHYDARPINAYDHNFTYTAVEQVALAGTATASFSYKVPAGRVMVARDLQLAAWFTADPFGGVGGAPNVLVTASFRIGGAVIPGANNMNVDGAIQSATVFRPYLKIPLYFLAFEGETVQLRITTTVTTFTRVAPLFHTNMLLASGINRTSEPGTQNEIPIRQVGAR